MGSEPTSQNVPLEHHPLSADEPPPYESVILGQADDSEKIEQRDEKQLQKNEGDLFNKDHQKVEGEAGKVVSEYEQKMHTAQADSSRVDHGHVQTGQQKSISFDIKVIDPVRQGEGVSQFVSYKVTSQASGEGYRPEKHEVIRRYRDFVWLRNRLRSQYRGIILPALPEKNVLEKYKMTADFIEQRRSALNVFINRVAAHNILNRSPDLRLFLQADETEFAIESSRIFTDDGSAVPAGNSTAAIAARKTISEAAKIFKSLSRSIANNPSNTQRTEENGDDGPSNVLTKESEDVGYLKIRSYMSSLDDLLSESHQSAERLSKQHAALASALFDFSSAIGALSRHQEVSKSGPVDIKNDDNDSIFDVERETASRTIAHLSAQASLASAVCRKTSDELKKNFEAPMKESSRSIKSCKKSMSDRADALNACKTAREDVENRRLRLSRLRSTPGVREDRVAQAERDFQASQRRFDELSEQYASICRRMDDDLIRFQRERVVEMKQILKSFVEIQDRSAQELAILWRRLAASPMEESS